MPNYFGIIKIPVADFYDLLLAKYYGEMLESSCERIKLRMYKWDDNYYVEQSQ